MIFQKRVCAAYFEWHIPRTMPAAAIVTIMFIECFRASDRYSPSKQRSSRNLGCEKNRFSVVSIRYPQTWRILLFAAGALQIVALNEKRSGRSRTGLQESL